MGWRCRPEGTRDVDGNDAAIARQIPEIAVSRKTKRRLSGFGAVASLR